jgi:hypothetical protein
MLKLMMAVLTKSFSHQGAEKAIAELTMNFFSFKASARK